ncbi:MAG: hypothetical protein ABEJ03_00615 [Candidatus Nanohaloarchaea archaeon]
MTGYIEESLTVIHPPRQEVEEDRVREEVAENLQRAAELFEVEEEKIRETAQELDVVFDSATAEPPFIRMSDPSMYQSQIGNFLLNKGASEVVRRNSQVPLHEVVEGAAHVVSEIPVESRTRGDGGLERAVNEIFGGMGLGNRSRSLLENDKRVIERNLDELRRFHSETEVGYVIDRMDEMVSVTERIAELDPCEDDVMFEIDLMRARLMDDLPYTLEDSDHSGAKPEVYGSFSEGFIETIVVPFGEAFDPNSPPEYDHLWKIADSPEEYLPEEAARNLDYLERADEESLRSLNRAMMKESAQKDLDYLAGRTVAQRALDGEYDPAELVRRTNDEIASSSRYGLKELRNRLENLYLEGDSPTDIL